MDGSGWEAVYDSLRKRGYSVSVVQNPTISLDDDVRVTRNVIAVQDGPVILVGHSYGGVVITEAGNDPKVVGLVYIAAFAPDKGESVSSLIKDSPPGAPVPPILPPQDGFLFLDKAKFAESFAADVDATKAQFMPFDWATFGLEILNFLVLVWLLARFLYRPIIGAIAKRKAEIADTVAVAQAKEAEAHGPARSRASTE